MGERLSALHRPQQDLDVAVGGWRAEQVALIVPTAELAQDGELLGPLDALGDDPEALGPAEREDCGDQLCRVLGRYAQELE